MGWLDSRLPAHAALRRATRRQFGRFLASFIDGEINCVFRQLFPPPHVSCPPLPSLSLLRLLRENIIKCGRHRPINIPCSTSERTNERTNRRRDGQLGVDSPLLFPPPSRPRPSLVLFLRVLPPRARHSPFSRASVPTLHSAAHLARPADEPSVRPLSAVQSVSVGRRKQTCSPASARPRRCRPRSVSSTTSSKAKFSRPPSRRRPRPCPTATTASTETRTSPPL